MATLQTKAIQPSTGSNVNLGTTGDAVLLSSDSIKMNLYKDSGGNTLFQSDGAGTLSNVNSALLGNGPVLILSQTASNSANLSFTSGIDSSYDSYMFLFVNINPVTDNVTLTFQVSSDGGSSYGINITSTSYRAYHFESGASGLGFDPAASLSQSTSYQKIIEKVGNGADECCAGDLYLYQPSSTTYVKHWITRMSTTQGAISIDQHGGGYVNSTSAVDAINFKMSSGNFDGIIKMYGIS